MKKSLLSLFSLCVGIVAIGQQVPHKMTTAANVDAPNYKVAQTGLESIYGPVNTHFKPSAQLKAINEVAIGETVYDLQTNASVQNRNVVHADGTISATFTMGDVDPSFTDRGAGYNYYSASSWDPFATTRIETTRNGWPALVTTSGGTEVIVSHSGVTNFTVNRRNPKGTGAWTESIIPTATGHPFFWPKTAVGGPSGNTIHCIGITVPVGNGGTPYMGVDGALLYFRSTDEGATWDIVDYLDTALDSTKFNRTRADSYSIIADGNNVAIAVFNQWADMILLKSTDNGVNWSSQIVNDFPLDLYITDTGSDIDNDNVADTISTCDEAGSMLYDAQGNVHLTFGHMRVLDADTTDDNTTYFPNTQELLYWNESMGPGNFTTIAVPEDINQNQVLDYAGSFVLYYTALCGNPTMSSNAAGTMFVTYHGYKEDYFTATQNYRHIHVIKSEDGGVTWTAPYDVTPDPLYDGLECVFPCMAEAIDDKIRISYQRDYEPGLAARGDLDAYAFNEIMYIDVDTVLNTGVGIDEIEDLGVYLNLFPNPSSTTANVQLTLEKRQHVSITLTDMIGQRLPFSQEAKLGAGVHNFPLNTHDLSAGVYFITITVEGINKVEKLIVQH
jgi:hypothetical protein